MKAKKAIAFTKEVADLLPEKLTDVDYMNDKSTMYGAGFVAAISIINKLIDEEEDDEELTPENIADVVVAGCVMTAQFADVINIIDSFAKEGHDED